MKNINTKKVIAGAAALALGASFLGAAVAGQVTFGNPIAKSDVISETGSPTATIVIGEAAQSIDSMWAGNIAAAIASKAYKTETHTTEDIVLPGEPSSTTTISGDGKLYDSQYLGTAGTPYQTGAIKETDYSLLTEMDIDYDNTDGDSETLNNVKDTLKVKYTDTYFEKNEDVKQLLMKIPGGDGIIYELNLDTGIPANLTTSDDHDLSIPFMGQIYTVKSATYNKIELISEANKQSYMQGESFTVAGAGTYDDKELTVEVTTVSSNSRVMLKLMDGTTVLASETVKEGKSTTFGGKCIEITVPTVNYADNGGSYVEITTSSGGAITLEDGDMVDEFKEGEREWEVNFTCADASCDAATDLITKITVTNADGWDQLPIDGDEDYPALKVGEKALFPNNFGAVEFLGLTDETMHKFETDNGRIMWEDKDNESHDVPMYQERSDDARMNIEIDGKTYYFHYNNDDTITVREGSDVTSDVVAGGVFAIDQVAGGADLPLDYVTTNGLSDIPIGTLTHTDAGDTTATDFNTSYFYITSDVDDLTKLYFAIVNNGNQWGVALANRVTLTGGNLAASDPNYTIADASNYWNFNGTDSTANDSVDKFYFDGTLASDTGYAIFTVNDDTSAGTNTPIKFYIDPENKKLADSKDYTSATPSMKLNYDAAGTAYDFDLDDEDDTDISDGITLRGTEISISNKEVLIEQPEKARAIKMFVGGGVETVVEEGEPGSTIPGITYTTTVPVSFNPMNLVKMDTATIGSAGTKIVVGGHMVNQLAMGVTEDYLTEEGQWIMGKDPTTGNIIVAGWTGQDTGAAASAFINAIQ